MHPNYLRHPLLRQANALRAQLPSYLHYSLDIEEGSGLEPEEVPDAYGISDRQYEESRKKMDTITHEKTPDTHSAIVGGSSASRILGCPGSVDLLAKIPAAVLNESSSYADEGTGLHEIMAYLVENPDVGENDIINDPKVAELWETYQLDDKRLWDAVLPAYRSFNAYLDTLYETDDDEVRIRVESKVEMPGIEGAFGTCDVLIRAPKKTVVWDWKFGQGVPVLASYKVKRESEVGYVPDDEAVFDEFGNDQLMFYARAAMHSYPDYFVEDPNPRPVELVICQPRILDEELSTFETATDDLESFRLDLIDAVEEAQSGKGQLKKGSYCRFAKCKTLCPLWTQGAVDMTTVGEKLGKLQMQHAARTTEDRQTFAVPEGHEAVRDVEGRATGEVKEQGGLSYAEALAAMLTLSEIVEPYIKEAYAQAHAFMEAGGIVPGHKLVPKKAGWDSWNDPKETDDFLSRRKLSVEERRKPWEPITPAVARKALKAKGDDKGVKLLEKYVKAGVSSGTTIAPADDAREAVQATATMVKSLADKIASL
jgi:hypothetical protein